jgi:cytochrome d ubiquinol oxidase subunit I
MRTADSVTPSLTGGDVLASLLMYVVVYLLMYPAGIGYMASLVRAGVDASEAEDLPIESGRPKEPFTTAAGPLG